MSRINEALSCPAPCCVPAAGRELAIETHSLTQPKCPEYVCGSQLAPCLVLCSVAMEKVFKGKSRLQMFPNRCNLFPLSSKPCIAPHTAPCIHHLWSPASRRCRLESELHSVQDLFRSQKYQRQKALIWEIALFIALALRLIFTQGVHCP